MLNFKPVEKEGRVIKMKIGISRNDIANCNYYYTNREDYPSVNPGSQCRV